MKNTKPEDFRITQPIKIKDLQTNLHLDASKEEIEKELSMVSKKLGDLQNTLYAHGKYGVLVCFQGMDTAGKDSLIREVFKEFNVRGVVCHSFKTPTALELRHNYLWRHYVALPERGKYSVFNRTHYENVLVTRVHPEYLLYENIPGIENIDDVNEAFWNKRFQQINDFEKTIADNGTIIFKFFLNLSKEEQKNRLLRRLDKKSKNWKFSPGDLKERKLWDSYMKNYEDAINKTSFNHAPWYNIPADDKPTARYLVTKTLLEVMQTYTDIQEPELAEELKLQIPSYIEQLNKE
ncbi:MAG: phosphate--nucleotide phosphotransferase [Flavobacteriaceae bacterium CG_4_8_14_3_um_filter_34_10]|nr:polyphosphate kinase 2 family protein [Flavobacteriia bacterium]OIP50171.1 MAG: phosphate--nucleotide phosphotransferase [Flavobacteriaceae bacterium CG2_30_34_30]PIQ19008.1 MAG: phosphate--nucleotide phosphotransferase [Flavobacteriaceae bacterium CG18_big_fil_WC_8_21_14_2_50_34_36]PIV49402.1 MAG: phosphate--nucleotide phosphotransferase [Flavobacteriaceae bacterium CG02_land_8_20_14_3_00_34_13]PIX09201.1 MAG: phosphate--nucleotide phosphotransferase [Flavobacteriaceae bacterium CG_4_8_14_3